MSEKLHYLHNIHYEEVLIDDLADVNNGISFYEKDFQDIMKGPQTEGLSEEEITQALMDERTISIAIETDSDPIVLPVFTPVEYTSWYNQQFFEKNKEQFKEVLHFSASPSTVSLMNDNHLAEISKQLKDGDKTIVFDHQEGSSEISNALNSLLNNCGLKYEERFLGDEQGAPSKELHFVGKTHLNPEASIHGIYQGLSLTETYNSMVVSGEINEQDGTSLLYGPNISSEELTKLWDIYREPFAKLIEDDPLRMALNRDEFDDMMTDPASINIVHRNEGGDIVAFMQLVNNLKVCSWLNEDYYAQSFNEAYTGNELWYFPGVVTDINNRGEMHSFKLVQLMTKLASAADIQPTLIFECSEISATYIPEIVSAAISETKLAAIDIQNYATYDYRCYQLLS